MKPHIMKIRLKSLKQAQIGNTLILSTLITVHLARMTMQ